MGRLHVQRRVNGVGQLGHLYGESLLDLLHLLLILGARDERDSKTLGTEAASTTHSVQVLVRHIREVIVDDDVHSLNIDTTTEQVSGHQDSLVELLEGLEAGDALVLLQVGVDADRGEVAVLQQLGQLHSSLDLGHEDHNLVEVKDIQQVVQLLVLLGFVQLHEVLLQTVQSQLGVIVDEDLHGLHEKHNK